MLLAISVFASNPAKSSQEGSEARQHVLFEKYKACEYVQARRYAKTTATASEVVLAVRSKCRDERLALRDEIASAEILPGTPENAAKYNADRVLSKLDDRLQPELMAAVLDARMP